MSTTSSEPTRVLIAIPRLDGHDRGAKVVVRWLPGDGMEVVYTGLRQTPGQILETLVDEARTLSGSRSCPAHMTLVPRILDLIREQTSMTLS